MLLGKSQAMLLIGNKTYEISQFDYTMQSKRTGIPNTCYLGYIRRNNTKTLYWGGKAEDCFWLCIPFLRGLVPFLGLVTLSIFSQLWSLDIFREIYEFHLSVELWAKLWDQTGNVIQIKPRTYIYKFKYFHKSDLANISSAELYLWFDSEFSNS